MLSQRILWNAFREPRRGGNSDFAMTVWRRGVKLSSWRAGALHSLDATLIKHT